MQHHRLRHFGDRRVCSTMLLIILLVGQAAGLPAGDGAAKPPFSEALATLQHATSGDAETGRRAAAWQTVASASYAELPAIFAALDAATPFGANWLGTAVDCVIESQESAGEQLPVPLFEQVAADPNRGLRTRQLALELIERDNSDLAKALRSSFLTDPQEVFRRPAIAAAVEQLKQEIRDGLPREQQIAQWKRLFSVVRDPAQASSIARELERLEQPVDLARHFGSIRHWVVQGPYENIDGEGFGIVYPPESTNWREVLRQLNEVAEANSPMKSTAEPAADDQDSEVSWQPVNGSSRDGNVDLNEVFGKRKDVLAYGAAVVESDREQPVEVRLRVQNAFKLWLNGEQIFEQPVGHTGNSFDQYTVKAGLRKGENLFLIKSCQVQPIQEMEFFDVWHFCVRLSDATGGGLTSCTFREFGAPSQSDRDDQ
jgi:hypothetical protein